MYLFSSCLKLDSHSPELVLAWREAKSGSYPRNWTCLLSSLCASREHAYVRLATAHEQINSNSCKKCLLPSLSQKTCVISSWPRALLPWFTLSSAWLLEPSAPCATQMQNKKLKNQTHSEEFWLRNAFVYEARVRLILVHWKHNFKQSLGNSPANFSWAHCNRTMEKVRGRNEWPAQSQSGWTFLILLSYLHPLSRYPSENSADERQ